MKVCVVMPAFNESSGITDFLNDLNSEFDAFSPKFFVIDDKSTDGMQRILDDLSRKNPRIKTLRNEANLGHGPSTVKALRIGLESGSDYIVAVDGDGQFLGKEVAETFKILISAPYDVVEGVRTFRSNPTYRQFVSAVTRLLVFFRCGKFPKDANTPLRAYRRPSLEFLLSEFDDAIPVPNLLISVKVRKSKLSVCEHPVVSISRRGDDENSVSWNNKISFFPSLTFIRFSLNATKSFWKHS